MTGALRPMQHLLSSDVVSAIAFAAYRYRFLFVYVIIGVLSLLKYVGVGF